MSQLKSEKPPVFCDQLSHEFILLISVGKGPVKGMRVPRVKVTLISQDWALKTQ